MLNNPRSRNGLFILVCLFSFPVLEAQDLIVTTEGDSVECSIDRIEEGIIYFSYIRDDDLVKTLIPEKNTTGYFENYFDHGLVTGSDPRVPRSKPSLRLAVNGGFSYLMGKIDDAAPQGEQDYLKGLKTGAHLNGDLDVFFGETYGVGFRYNVFMTRNEAMVTTTQVDGSTTSGTVIDNVRETFIGPTYCTRFLAPRSGNALIMSIGLGYMGYRNNATFINEFVIRGSTAGNLVDIGYDFRISEGMSLGISMSMITGFLTEFEVQQGTTTRTVELEQGSYQSMNRFDLSLGLRFGK